MVRDGIDLYWIPLGAGGRVVAACGRTYERLLARWQHRPVRPLFHAALAVTLDGTRYVVEMAPVWGVDEAERGVVQRGPVGLRVLGRLPAFRYEVRCWPDGRIPDEAWADGGARRLTDERLAAVRAVELVRAVPALTWGRDQLGAGEMWSSNSLTAWLLAWSGLDPVRLEPPLGGRAPGWRAGLALARLPEGPDEPIDPDAEDVRPSRGPAGARRLLA